MKKALFIFILLSASTYAQVIPNPGFESWFVEIWQPVPEGWATPNGQLIPVVVQDLEAYEGNFAMRVNAVNDGIGAYGWAACTLDTDNIPPSLDFYVKALAEFGGVSVSISFYNNEIEVYTEFWSSGESIDEWTFVSMPLDQIEPVMTHAIIRVEASVGDLVPGQAWISVDAMSFGSVQNISSQTTTRFEMMPNPAVSSFTLKNLPLGGRIRLINSVGQITMEENTVSDQAVINVEDLNPGIYFVEVVSVDGSSQTRKLILGAYRK